MVPQDYQDLEIPVNTDAFSPTDPEENHTNTGDLDIIDIEVTNTETETTVNLVHLLGLRQRPNDDPNATNGWDMMESIEESEEEDSGPEGWGTGEVVLHTFSGLIPALVVYNEKNCLIDTIHKGREPLSCAEEV